MAHLKCLDALGSPDIKCYRYDKQIEECDTTENQSGSAANKKVRARLPIEDYGSH